MGWRQSLWCCLVSSPCHTVMILFFLHRENHKNTAEELVKFLPKVEQILWLFKCCPFGRQKGQVQPGLHVAVQEHLGEQYKRSWQTLNCSTEPALCRSRVITIPQTWRQLRGTSCSKASFTAQFRSEETRKEIVTCFFAVLFTDTQGNFWLTILVVQKAESA